MSARCSRIQSSAPWITRLDKLLEENQELQGYDSVRRHARTWRIRHDKNKAAAFIPLILDPGEACQFDWSEEKLLIGGSHWSPCRSPTSS